MDVPVAAKLVLGLALLVGGGHFLVRSASKMALAWGVSPLVIGLTVVAFGTSAPELAVSLHAGWEGKSEVALGNVVGSNIFNVLFILGLSAVITPLAVAQQFVRKEVPFLIAISVAAWALSAGGRFGAPAAVFFLVLLVAYTALAVRRGRREAPAVKDEYATMLGERPRHWAFAAGAAAVSLAVLVLGSRVFVDGAAGVARAFGISDLVIAMTIVAPGTSLPEVVTSVVAALKGERDIAVANVLGSNIFNLLGVLGASALVGGGIAVPPAAIQLDFPVMVAASVACLPILVTGHRVNRGEGLLLLAYYAAYVVWLILAASSHVAQRALAIGLLGFALPLTVLGLLLSVLHWRRYRRT